MPKHLIHTTVKPVKSISGDVPSQNLIPVPGPSAVGFRKTNFLDTAIIDIDPSTLYIESAHYQHCCSHLDLNVKRGPARHDTLDIGIPFDTTV